MIENNLNGLLVADLFNGFQRRSLESLFQQKQEPFGGDDGQRRTDEIFGLRSEAMSETDRRMSFRAARSEVRYGTLRWGRDRVGVMILDESAGGFSVCADESLGLAVESEAELWIDNGDVWRVQVKHLERRGILIRIGLERVELMARGRLGNRSVRGKTKLGAATIVVATLIGYLVGTNLPHALGMWSDRSGVERSEPSGR